MVASLLQTGTTGIQQGLQRAQAAADQIVADVGNREPADANSASQTDLSQRSPLASLSESLVDLVLAEHQVKASAQVVKTADELVGTLIDTLA